MADTKNAKFYSTLVFDDNTMKKYLDAKSYKAFRDIVENGKKLSINLADKIAAAMKDWAVSKGATHFTH